VPSTATGTAATGLRFRGDALCMFSQAHGGLPRGRQGRRLLGAALKHHHAPGGLYERIFLGLELLWIAVAAIAVARRDPATQPE
jgi:hypothetical protein